MRSRDLQVPVPWAVAVAALLAACGEEPMDPRPRELDGARARWERAGIAAYTYEYRMSCFCPPQLLERTRVTVRDGAVTSVFLVDSGKEAAAESVDWYYTVDGLFDRLAADLAREPAVFEVVYDEATGYPTSASVDISRQMADEEYSFTAADLVSAAP